MSKEKNWNRTSKKKELIGIAHVTQGGVYSLERYRSRLKEYRESAGLTQQELSDETGVAVRTIALIETKEGSNPSVGTLKRLLAYFKITFEELFP